MLWTLVYQASELQRLLTQKENLLVLGDQKGLFSSPEMVTLLNADVLLVTASLHPKGYFSGGEIEATTGNTSVFTDYEMAVEVYLKQETKFKIRNFFSQDIMII